MPRWNPIELPAEAMLQAAADREVEPIRVYWTEFDTTLDVQRDAFVYYLLHPLPVLSGQLPAKGGPPDDVRRELDGLTLEGVDEEWRMVTVLRNHHRGLNPRVNFASATVSTEESAV